MPDWGAMMGAAQTIALPEGPGYIYLVADSHLGDSRAPGPEFIAMLRGLPHAKAVVFLGDLFQVWLALPKYWDANARAVLDGFRALQVAGTRTVFVVGNREFFLPRTPAATVARGLPFDHIVPGAAVMTWAGRRYGLTHGDVVNRRDSQYLKWRHFSRGRAFEALFRAMPGSIARRVAAKLERALAGTNKEIKIQYPADELEAFASTVLPGLDDFFIGHFHRDEVIAAPGQIATLRIIPDWFSRKVLVRLDAKGGVEKVTP
jgi:UDP-2,3-diacylglucosamine pyrophosphatase LpxH